MCSVCIHATYMHTYVRGSLSTEGLIPSGPFYDLQLPKSQRQLSLNPNNEFKTTSSTPVPERMQEMCTTARPEPRTTLAVAVDISATGTYRTQQDHLAMAGVVVGAVTTITSYDRDRNEWLRVPSQQCDSCRMHRKRFCHISCSISR